MLGVDFNIQGLFELDNQTLRFFIDDSVGINLVKNIIFNGSSVVSVFVFVGDVTREV